MNRAFCVILRVAVVIAVAIAAIAAAAVVVVVVVVATSARRCHRTALRAHVGSRGVGLAAVQDGVAEGFVGGGVGLGVHFPRSHHRGRGK